MATTIALKGANPGYFPNVNAAGMPVLNQKALDALLTKYKSNSLNAGQYRDNYNAFGWNVKSDGSSVLRGPAIFGLDMGTLPGSSLGQTTRGIVKAGTNVAATPKEFQTAATQLGINYSDYVKPTAFVATGGGMGYVEQATTKNTKQYTDPVTGKSYLARIDTKGNYVTNLNQAELYNAINDKSKDLYMVANALDRTGVAANKKGPHASVLFRADGSGNLLPVTLPTGEIAATPYQAVGVSHAGWQGQLAELAPLIGFAALAVGAPYLSSLFSGGAAAGSAAASGGVTAGLTASQVGAAGILGSATMPTLTQIGAAMLEGSLISGGIAAVTGGDIGRAMLTGALTGGASSYVSGALATGALGSIAQNFSAMGNAIATGAIVSAGEAALTGQPWLKAGLIGGASSGIMYVAADWAKDAFSKPAGAKPGTMVVDKNGNVVQIDADGKGVFQPDMFAAVGDNQTITIADKAGNIVNSTNADMPISPVYDDAISTGAKPPTVGLSQRGEIDGIEGTATYYTNGKASWTPLNNQPGVDAPFGTADLIPSSTTIKSEVVWDNGVPKVQQVTASGSTSVGNMNNSYNTEISYNGQSGNLSQYNYGDEVVYAFKPAGAATAAPVDLTDDFANGFVDTKGNFVDSTGKVRSNLNNNYVDSSGQVYDVAGNPVAKLTGAITAPNTANVDWSGILKDNGTIARTNGDILSAATGTFTSGSLQGQLAEAGVYSTEAAKIASSPAGITTPTTQQPAPPVTPEAPTTAPVTPDVPAQPTPSYVDNNGIGYDAMGNPVAPATPATPDMPAQYTAPVNVAPVVNNVPTGFSQDQAARLMNTNLAKTGSLDINAVNGFVAQGYTPDQIIQAVDNNPNGGWANYNTGIRSMNPGATVTPAVPVAPTQPTTQTPAEIISQSPVVQATQPTPPTTTVPETPAVTAPAVTAPVVQPTPSYVDTSGIGYDNLGNPVAPATPATPTTPAQYTVPVNVAPITPPVTTAPVAPAAPKMVQSTAPVRLYDQSGYPITIDPTTNKVYWDPDMKIEAVNHTKSYQNGTLYTRDVTSTSSNPFTRIGATGTNAPGGTGIPMIEVAPPPVVTPPAVTPQPTPSYVDTSGIGYDNLGNPVAPATPATPTTPAQYTVPVNVAPTTPTTPTTPAPVVTPPAPVTNQPYVDTSGTAYDAAGNPVGPATTPGATGTPYVDQNGNLYNSQGQIVDNFMNNYVDKSGVVYDDLGNPAGQLTGTKPGSTVDYSGMLQPGGIIKTTEGGIVNVNTGTVAPPATEVMEPSVPGSNYVDQSGTLYDQYGNPTKDLTGNYVDSSGTVYDEFGNPAGSFAPGTIKVPGADLSGIINNNGTITKPDGSLINQSGQIVAPPGTITPPTTPDYVAPTTPTPTDPVTAATAGVIVGQTLTPPPEAPTAGRGYTLKWGTVPTINLPGVNPGTYAQAVKPYYTQGTPIQSQYYWGKHPYAATEADLANYNNIPGAPAQPWGAQFSAVGGNRQLNIPEYVRQNITQGAVPSGYFSQQPQYTAMPVAPTTGVYGTGAVSQTPTFATPAAMSVNLSQGVPQQVSIPTWSKSGQLTYVMPEPVPVAP